MAPRFRADINLDFSLQEASGEEARGSVKASGSEVVVALDRIDALLSHRMPSLGDLRPLAKTLSDQGLSVVVDGPDGRIISLGAVEAPASQRVITRSPHIKLGKLGALAPMLKRGRRSPARGIFPAAAGDPAAVAADGEAQDSPPHHDDPLHRGAADGRG